MKIRVSPDRWRVIEGLFHEALEREAAGRGPFLAAASAGDSSLREEVEALLDAHESSGGFIENPPAALSIGALSNERAMPLPGTRIGAYRLVSLLAVGGMGEVYLAEDPKLGRKIALKLLPPRFTSNRDLVRRFALEARIASSLNHPNIVTVFDIGEDDGIQYIATEFVDGETLRQRMARAELKVKEAVDIAVQVASALAAGHDAGITHRDIKPENIMVRKDGYVKVLDFGLAKLSESIESDRRSDGWMSMRTDPGTVMGTISYMSPEQARGQEVDCRSDIFSLGVVLYEMIAGEAPFKRDTPAATYDAILNHSPKPITVSSGESHAGIESIVAKSLEKDRAARYQAPADLMRDLRQLSSLIDSGAASLTALRTPRRVRLIRTGLIAVTSVLVVAAAWYFFLRPTGVKTALPFSGAIAARVTERPGPELFPSLSPDGKTLVYASNGGGDWDIYLQRVEGQNPTNLTDDSTDDETQPAFSPDGEHIAFRSERHGGGIFVMGATGENVRRVADFGFNPAWSPDGQEIVVGEDLIEQPASRSTVPSKLWSVKTATGERRLISAEDAVQPHWSPHGHRIAYWGLRRGGQRDVWTIPAQGGEPVRVTDDDFFNWNPVWSPDGRYLYFASDRSGTMNLWRVSIDEESGKVLGAPEPVTTPSGYSQHISFSRDGSRLAYVQVANRINIQRVGFDPASGELDGKKEWVTQGSRRTAGADISPDDQWLVFYNYGETQEDLFIIKSDGTGLRQITDDVYRDRGPRWSPDGEQIAFYSDRSGKYEIWLIRPDGSGLRQLTFTEGGTSVYYPYWSPDGRRLSYAARGEPTSIIDVEVPWSEQTPRRLRLEDPNLRFIAWSWSPDGTKLAGRQAMRGEASAFGIRVFSLGSGRVAQLTDFGDRPFWLSDNRRLLFTDEQAIYLVDEETKKVTELLSVEPDRIQRATVSHDDRAFYLSIETAESDVWVLTATTTETE